ncbi:hypothetical protein BJV78DRAFT_357991 [Lactifluus subvellereus]|nr:hypothetical protein BJV78DRAFT_357991 [Lactifluus subvellereus]
MPQLETLRIGFYSPLPNRDVARQLLDTPIMTQITLPNLREFWFKGVSAYLEGLLAWISAPVLRRFSIVLFNQQTFTVPHLSHFMGAPEALRFSTVRLAFDNPSAHFQAVPLEGQRWYQFQVRIMCRFSIHFSQYSLLWRNSYSGTRSTVNRQSGTTRSTAHCGANFSDRSAI